MKRFLSAVTAVMMGMMCLCHITPYAATTTTLPASCDNSNSIYFPDIGDQGNMDDPVNSIGSCVAWASTYYHFTYEVNRFKQEPTTANNTYSPTWTFNYTNGGSIYSSNPGDAYDVLANQGAMKLVDLPYDPNPSTYSMAWSEDHDKMIEALEYRATCETSTVTNSQGLLALKSMLNAGKIVTVGCHPQGWTERQVTGSKCNGEKIIVRSNGTGYGHHVTVVGYDDNIEVAVNGVTLKGALKIANSQGDGFANDGYIWIAYDALYATSAFGNTWQNGMAGTRVCVFSDNNKYYYINVFKSDVKFVGMVIFASSNPWAITIKANPGTTATEVKFKQSGRTSVNAVPRYVYFDCFNNDATYDMNNYLSSTWTMNMSSSNPPVETNQISFVILDNLGNTIAGSTNQGGIMSNGTYMKRLSTNLAKGRVTAYDNHEITSADAEKVLNYLVGNVELSNLQLFLADYRSDGEVNIQDVIAMNQHISSLSGQSYQITDYIEEWGYSLADVIEEEYDTTIEEYVAENYAELSAMNVIPAELREDVHAY